jgi:multiple antibiotic resistance protein
MALTDYPAYFLYVFISVFVVVNPIQAALVFISLTSGNRREERKWRSLRATNISFAIAMLFALAGDAILRFFGITVDSRRVAGGILLFLVAIDDMLRGKGAEEGYRGGDG